MINRYNTKFESNSSEAEMLWKLEVHTKSCIGTKLGFTRHSDGKLHSKHLPTAECSQNCSNSKWLHLKVNKGRATVRASPWVNFSNLLVQSENAQTVIILNQSLISLTNKTMPSFATKLNYKVCHRFRLINQDDYFGIDFDHFWIKQYFWRQLEQFWKLALA